MNFQLRSIEIFLHIISEKLYSIGLSLFRVSDQKRRKLCQPLMVAFVLSLTMLRDLISLSLNDRLLSMKLGDFSFNWKLKAMWNVTIISGALIGLTSQAIHCSYYHGHCNPFWIHTIVQDKFQFVVSKNIHFNKYYKFILLAEWQIRIWTLIGILIPFVAYLVNRPVLEAFTIGIVSSLINFNYSLLLSNIAVWQMLYYCMLIYKFKLQLKLENIKINSLAISSKVNVHSKILPNLRKLNKIFVLINKFDSFWSKIFLSMTACDGIIICMAISQLFGNVGLFMKCMLVILISGIAVNQSFLFIMASCVYMEANKSHLILSRLFANKIINYLLIKIKVNSNDKILI